MAGGKGNIKPEDGKQFSKDYQPSGEAKKRGKLKKKLLKDISEMIIAGDFEQIAENVARAFGISPREIDVETLADLRQLQKAITTGDTRAYNSFKDRLRGRPKQAIDVTSGGKELSFPTKTIYKEP